MHSLLIFCPNSGSCLFLKCLLMHKFLVGVQSHLFIYISSVAFALGSWASLVVQVVKNLPAVQDTPV